MTKDFEKPSHSEDEYFAREDALKKQKLALEQQKRIAAQQKEELKKLHFMHCPKCGMELHTITYRGVDIDRCFNCGGHFLEAGELEKLAAPDQAPVVSAILNWFKPSK
jgi:hypothetical protein